MILQTSMEDSGQYECQAQQVTLMTSEAKSVLLQVKILHKPYWNGSNKTTIRKQLQPNETIKLVCKVLAFPTPVITWNYNGEPLSQSTYFMIKKNLTTSTLYLTMPNTSLIRMYTCRAENHLGNLERNFIINLTVLTTNETRGNQIINNACDSDHPGYLLLIIFLALILIINCP